MKFNGVKSTPSLEDVQLTLFKCIQYDLDAEKNIRTFIDVFVSYFDLSHALLIHGNYQDVYFSSNIKTSFELTDKSVYAKIFKKEDDLAIKTLRTTQKAYLKLAAELRLGPSKIAAIKLDKHVLILIS